ncbi:hypothetical protein K502DRAFT_348589 [Neoconidiobolus thromboides FSU 785]|nr:hypothetical protein K502DRAFT_348589 [Neoconidiobolus thromboides FSU 785]
MENSNENTPAVGSLIKIKKQEIQSHSNEVTVLEEETYTSAIDHIIERDFFPDLKYLKERNDEIIDFSTTPRLENSEIQRRNELLNSQAAPGLELGLDQFFTKFTSEDNASFSEIVKKDLELKRKKYHWLYKDEEDLISSTLEKKLITNSSEQNEQSLIHIPTEQKQVVVPRNELEDFREDNELNKREYQKIKTWRFKAKNNLMFVPDGQPYKAPDTELYLRSQSKEIVHSNTRLPKGMNVSYYFTSNRVLTFIKLGTTPSTPSTNLSQIGGFNASNKNYDLVEATPAPNPDILGDNNPMTWGFIESTPMAINNTPARTPKREFALQEPDRREALSIKLTQSARKALHQRKIESSPYARQENKHGLSPAANKLLKNTTKSTSIFPSKLRNSFTLQGKLNYNHFEKIIINE